MADNQLAGVNIPNVPIDRVMFTDTGTITIPNSTGLVGTLNRLSISSKMIDWNYMPIVLGIYSYDGGATWAALADFDTSNPAFPGLSIRMLGRTDIALAVPQAVDFVIYVDATVGGGSTIDILVKYAIILGPDNEGQFTVDNDFAQETSYDSRRPTPKICVEGRILRDGATKTIPHNLGYVPDVLLTRTTNGGATTQRADQVAVAAGFYSYVDKTNLYISTANDGAYDNYRVYYKE